MVLGIISCDLDLNAEVKVNGQIMYFIVNASLLEKLDVVTSNFVPE